MDTSSLYVQLKVSFHKLLIHIGLLAILFVLTLQTMPSIWAFLLTVVAGFLSLFFRNRLPITAMAHLDQNTWTLARNSLKNSQVAKSNLQQQAGFEGMYYITAKRKEEHGQPIVIDKGKRPITVKEDMYSGSWGVASISIYGYNMSADNRGITAGLNGIQKVTDDDRLDGGSSVNDFENMEDENDDPFGMNA